LAASVQSRLNQRDLIVGEGASYARYLELGTRKMAARPHILPAIEKSWPQLEKQYRKVGFK
jgi:HK97 gp10 family phage protein